MTREKKHCLLPLRKHRHIAMLLVASLPHNHGYKLHLSLLVGVISHVSAKPRARQVKLIRKCLCYGNQTTIVKIPNPSYLIKIRPPSLPLVSSTEVRKNEENESLIKLRSSNHLDWFVVIHRKNNMHKL